MNKLIQILTLHLILISSLYSLKTTNELLEIISNTKPKLEYFFFVKESKAFLIKETDNKTYQVWHYTEKSKWRPISNAKAYDGFEFAINHFDTLAINKTNKTISFGNIVDYNNGLPIVVEPSEKKSDEDKLSPPTIEPNKQLSNEDSLLPIVIESREEGKDSILPLLQIIENKTISIGWYFWSKGDESFLFQENKERGIRLWSYTENRKWRPLYNTGEFDGFKKAENTLKDIKFVIDIQNDDFLLNIGDANLTNSNDALSITGTPRSTIGLTPNLKLKYSFTPIVNKTSLEFTISNKPYWLEIDSSTGKLEGVPLTVGEYNNITISATDSLGTTVSMEPFSIKVKPLENVARLYAKATQSPKGKYYEPPHNTIDGDYNTMNHTIDGLEHSWIQIELPLDTVIDSIKVYNRTGKNSKRFDNAKLFVLNSTYTGDITEKALHTYSADLVQEWKNKTHTTLGKYVLIKAQSFLHLREIEIYGTLADKPYIMDGDYNLTIDMWHSMHNKISQIQIKDSENRKITYSIEESVPFKIGNNGSLYPTNILSPQTYTFNVKGANEQGHVMQEVNIKVLNSGIVHTKFRTNDPTPTLTGYLPNTYKSEDSVSVVINGDKSYEATIIDDANWSIDDNVIARLGTGNHDISLKMNTQPPIVYKEYFEVFALRRQYQELSVTPDTISNIDMQIESSTVFPLSKNKRVRGTSVWFKNEDGITTLINDSFRTINTLIGMYVDTENVKHFVRLKFNQNIEPYSKNILESFNSSHISIFHTAVQHNMEIYFAGEGECGSSSVSGLTKSTLCTPTSAYDNSYSDTSVYNKNGYIDLSEQQIYTRVFSTWNHIYNRVDGINSIDAYVNGKDYKGMAYSAPHSQSANLYAPLLTREDFFAKSFFASLSPNNATGFQVMRYLYTVPGRAGVPPYSTTGEISPDSWAAIWEGNLRLDIDGNFNSQLYEHTEHESMHTRGMTHSSGLSYGWTNFAGRLFIPKYYPDGKVAIFDAPKYIFDAQVVSENTLEIQLYKTSDATKSHLKFDILSAKPNTGESFVFEEISKNKLKLTIANTVFPRFFIRMYAEDSDEFTSKFIDQAMMLQGKIGQDDQKRYYLFSHQDWKKMSDFLDYPVSTEKANKTCKLMTGNHKATIAKKEDANKIQEKYRSLLDDPIKWTKPKKFYANGELYDYEQNPYTVSQRAKSSAVITDESIGIMCVSPIVELFGG